SAATMVQPAFICPASPVPISECLTCGLLYSSSWLKIAPKLPVLTALTIVSKGKKRLMMQWHGGRLAYGLRQAENPAGIAVTANGCQGICASVHSLWVRVNPLNLSGFTKK